MPEGGINLNHIYEAPGMPFIYKCVICGISCLLCDRQLCCVGFLFIYIV